MNSQMPLLVSQLEFMGRAGDCALAGIGNFNPGQDLGIADSQEMSFIQKVLFDIAESFAQSIQQAINQGSASSVGAQGAAVGSQPQNNIVPFSRPEQAEFNVARALAQRESMGR